jgi:FlaA1/EpsC-like NDP-sugar epimerase
MPTRSARLYSLALIVGDFFVLLLAFTLAYVLRVIVDKRPLVEQIPSDVFIQTALILIPLWLLAFGFLGLYSNRVYNKRLTEWGRLLVGSFIGILIVLGYSFVIDQPVFPARLVAVYAFVGSFVLLVFGRELLRAVRTLMFRFGKGVSRVLIIGNTAATKDIAGQLSDTRRSGYHISAIAGPQAVVPHGFRGTRRHSSSLKYSTSPRSSKPICTIRPNATKKSWAPPRACT